ncbi:uncharacterized protein TOL2_C26480 [Desulfobacula toluolica Tol2]|uniref:Uncharacterized protein n=1 Tax=Desulfobacula toluolica (strain DSM 7467 / Tol2) TaxID=651182 RepID=K0NPL4_DESTT|nr:uncharacterized protein TOL2_C26480 [Desulfobacula toluolica Tol2]
MSPDLIVFYKNKYLLSKNMQNSGFTPVYFTDLTWYIRLLLLNSVNYFLIRKIMDNVKLTSVIHRKGIVL